MFLVLLYDSEVWVAWIKWWLLLMMMMLLTGCVQGVGARSVSKSDDLWPDQHQQLRWWRWWWWWRRGPWVRHPGWSSTHGPIYHTRRPPPGTAQPQGDLLTHSPLEFDGSIHTAFSDSVSIWYAPGPNHSLLLFCIIYVCRPTFTFMMKSGHRR